MRRVADPVHRGELRDPPGLGDPAGPRATSGCTRPPAHVSAGSTPCGREIALPRRQPDRQMLPQAAHNRRDRPAGTGSSNHTVIQVAQHPPDPQRLVRVIRPVRIHREQHVVAHQPPHLPHPRDSPRRGRADLHLDLPEPAPERRRHLRLHPRIVRPVDRGRVHGVTCRRPIPPSNRHTGSPAAFPARSHSAMSTPAMHSTSIPRAAPSARSASPATAPAGHAPTAPPTAAPAHRG